MMNVDICVQYINIIYRYNREVFLFIFLFFFFLCEYYYHIIIIFCYKVSKIQEKNCKIILVFDWLSRHIVYNFIYEWMWLCALIINSELISWD